MNIENVNRPAVSIIIPVHNPGEFLQEALASVHAQTFTDWELIIVDDNSSEDLTWVERDYPRARLIRQPHGGVSIARNNGILSSSGTYIAFMDQDDLWRPKKLERQVAALSKMPEAAICYCDLELIKSDVKFASVTSAEAAPQASKEDAEEPEFRIELDGTSTRTSKDGLSNLHRSVKFFSSRFIVPSTVLIRRKALSTSGLLDPFIPFTGDFDLIIKLGARHKVVRSVAVDVLYRTHENNFSNQYLVGRGEVEALAARYVAYARSKGDKELAKNAKKLFRRPSKLYSAQAFDAARASLRERNQKQFALHFSRALCYNPRFVLRSLSRWAQQRKGNAGRS